MFFDFLAEQWILASIWAVLLYTLLYTEKLKGGQLISPQQVSNLMNAEQAVVLDVRDSAEFRGGHIVDSINIPHAKVAERIGELEGHREKPIVVACKIGQHSGFVGKLLKAQGFDVRRLEGGVTEWQNSNMPLVKK